jgi:hypothetical protein
LVLHGFADATPIEFGTTNTVANTSAVATKIVAGRTFDWNYYTFYRIPVIINDKIISNDAMTTVPGREIGRVFAEYKDISCN